MAKIKRLPNLNIISGFKGKIDYYVYMGQPCARTWPRSPGPVRAPAVMARWQAFSFISRSWNSLPPAIREAYVHTAQNTNLTGRDLFTKNFISPVYLELEV